MKERKEGIAEIASLGAGLTGFAALLVGGCGGFTIWYGIPGDHHAWIIPMFGIPISAFFVLVFLVIRKNYLKPQKNSPKAILISFGILIVIPLLGVILKYVDLYFNKSNEVFTKISGAIMTFMLPVSALTVIIVLLFVFSHGASKLYKQLTRNNKSTK